MARCGCGGACGCSLSAGENTVVTGSGTSGNPWVIDSHTDCDEARACFAAGSGLAYDSTTGTFSAVASAQAGNTLTSGPGGLYVPASAVTTGCGLAGDGVTAPLSVNTLAWPFACAPEATGSVVTCDANGHLRGEPPYRSYYFERSEVRNYPATAVPAALITPVDTPFTFTVTNPDPCRAMRVLQWRDLDVDFDLPANSGAAYVIDTDEMYNAVNRGASTANTVHAQTGKLTQASASLAPGASLNLSLQVGMGRGFGGATYFLIQVSFRVFMIPA